MAEPDNIVLEHLRAIRSELDALSRQLDCVGGKVDGMADAAQIDGIARRLDGLTFVVRSSFGSVVHSLDSVDKRLARLQHESV